MSIARSSTSPDTICVNPVMLAPGRRRLETKPAPDILPSSRAAIVQGSQLGLSYRGRAAGARPVGSSVPTGNPEHSTGKMPPFSAGSLR